MCQVVTFESDTVCSCAFMYEFWPTTCFLYATFSILGSQQKITSSTKFSLLCLSETLKLRQIWNAEKVLVLIIQQRWMSGVPRPRSDLSITGYGRAVYAIGMFCYLIWNSTLFMVFLLASSPLNITYCHPPILFTEARVSGNVCL